MTMPHFAGRARALELRHRPRGYDFLEAADLLANAIRRECRGRAVTRLLHD